MVSCGCLASRSPSARCRASCPGARPSPEAVRRWMAFLRNHRDAIAAMDFFVVPTMTFRLLSVWSVIEHRRRRVVHFNVTDHPHAMWVMQQLREALELLDHVIVLNDRHLRRL